MPSLARGRASPPQPSTSSAASPAFLLRCDSSGAASPSPTHLLRPHAAAMTANGGVDPDNPSVARPWATQIWGDADPVTLVDPAAPSMAQPWAMRIRGGGLGSHRCGRPNSGRRRFRWLLLWRQTAMHIWLRLRWHGARAGASGNANSVVTSGGTDAGWWQIRERC